MIANEYAKALYELAKEQKCINVFQEEFSYLKEAIKDLSFYNVLVSPFIQVKEKKLLIDKIFKGFNKTFINFIYVLLDNNRFYIINDISINFEELILKQNDIVPIKLISAYKLTNEQLKGFTKSLEKKYKGRNLKIDNIVNPSIIGGVQIEAEGQILDLSLSNSLNKLKESL